MMTPSTGCDVGGDRATRDASPEECAQRYQAILDTAVDGIITIDSAGRIIAFNRAAERIFGWTAQEIMGQGIDRLMPEPDRSAHAHYMRSYLDGAPARIIGVGREVRGERRDGTTFPMDLAVGEVHFADRRMFTGIVRDITDRKNAEAEARRRLDDLIHVSRLASMGDMTSMLAHEVNQPLTAIISVAGACLRFMQSGRATPELLTESLQMVVRQGERAAAVIQRLRNFVRKSELSFRPDSLNVVIRDVVWLMNHDIAAMGVQLGLELDDDLPDAEMDAVQIEQVIFNLVRNALDAIAEARAEPPELIIRTQRIEADRICCEVIDNGKGLGDIDTDTLFQPYFTTKATGLGQGLSICRSIIFAHRGALHAGARADGVRGARFWFEIPLLQS